MGTPHRVINPKTGRRVLKKGKIGQAVVAAKKKKPAKKTTSSSKKCTGGHCNVTPKKKKGGPVRGKFYGYEGATKYTSPIVKRAGKTKNYAARPSARRCFDDGYRGPVCYGGKMHVMAFRSNGSPYWKEV